jgi:peptidoglycan/xylan/chitin deacetylase (PgdA/CDA1 family)
MGLFRRANSFVTRNLPLKPVRARPEAPLASISFDDFPRSAWTVGGPMLERYGAKATYYAAGTFCGRSEDGIDYFDAEDLKAIHAAGHEIGCHSFAHGHGPDIGTLDLAADAERNSAFLREHLGDFRPATYAYPYGDASPRTKALAAARYPASRGIRSGVNAGMIDLAQLKAVPLEHRRWRPDEVEAAIERAKAGPGWVIFFSHDVSDDPSPFGCTPQMLEFTLERLTRAGIEILPVKHALARAVFAGG